MNEEGLREKLSPEFDDLIKTLQFPDNFYKILDRVIKREVDEAFQKGKLEEREKIK